MPLYEFSKQMTTGISAPPIGTVSNMPSTLDNTISWYMVSVSLDSVEVMPRTPEANSPEFRRISPLGKIPALILDDGTTLFDSRVIVEYLDAASPVNRLIPDDPRDRLRVKRWEALADGCLDAAVEIVVYTRRPAAQQMPTKLMIRLTAGLSLRMPMVNPITHTAAPPQDRSRPRG